jgi:hypothetical protein
MQALLSGLSFIGAIVGVTFNYIKSSEFSKELIRYMEICEEITKDKINDQMPTIIEHYRKEISRLLSTAMSNIRIENMSSLDAATLDFNFELKNISTISDAIFRRRKLECALFRIRVFRWASVIFLGLSLPLFGLSFFSINNTLLTVVCVLMISTFVGILWIIVDRVMMKNLGDIIQKEYGISSRK